MCKGCAFALLTPIQAYHYFCASGKPRTRRVGAISVHRRNSVCKLRRGPGMKMTAPYAHRTVEIGAWIKKNLVPAGEEGVQWRKGIRLEKCGN